jgi:hypothetical protein
MNREYRAGPLVADCECCPFYLRGESELLIRAVAWLHNRRPRHEALVVRRQIPAGPATPLE